MKLFRGMFVIAFLTLSPSNAHALISVPTFRLATGFSPIKFTAGSIFPTATSLGSVVTLNPMFLWDIPTIRSRVGFHFLSDVGSPYGFVTTAGIGLTGILYPLGLSSSREMSQDFTEVIKTRTGPFLQFAITPTKFSVTQTPDPSSPAYNDPTLWPYFNVKVVEVSVGVGADYPLARDLMGFAGIHYRTAAFKELESGDGAITYSGLFLSVGIMTNFY